MKVIVDRNIPFVEGRLEKVSEVIYAAPSEITPELVKDADALIVRTRTKCDKELLEGSKVRFIASATIGTDHIDSSWCASNGITVANAPGCNAPAVAQYVWASILALGKKPEDITLGIVGKGNVGSIVADWGRRLGARIVVSDPPKMEAGIPDNYMPLPRLLECCDVITLHTPLTFNGNHPTFHLIGKEELDILSSEASEASPRVLINAARGEVVDNKTLYEAAREGKLRLAIDTWEGEPEISRELLGVTEIATFHIAGYSAEGKSRATRMALDAFNRHFNLDVDLSGLEPDYSPGRISPRLIADSYDPMADTAMLKKNPEDFERLRQDYNLRKETETI